MAAMGFNYYSILFIWMIKLRGEREERRGEGVNRGLLIFLSACFFFNMEVSEKGAGYKKSIKNAFLDVLGEADWV